MREAITSQSRGHQWEELDEGQERGRSTRRHDVGLVDGGEGDDCRDIIRSDPREHRGSMLLRDEGKVAGPQDLDDRVRTARARDGHLRDDVGCRVQQPERVPGQKEGGGAVVSVRMQGS